MNDGRPFLDKVLGVGDDVLKALYYEAPGDVIVTVDHSTHLAGGLRWRRQTWKAESPRNLVKQALAGIGTADFVGSCLRCPTL